MDSSDGGLYITLNDFSVVCRACLNKKGSKALDETCFMDLFKNSLDFTLEFALPRNVCNECSLKLEDFKSFKNLVQSSHIFFKKVLESNTNDFCNSERRFSTDNEIKANNNISDIKRELELDLEESITIRSAELLNSSLCAKKFGKIKKLLDCQKQISGQIENTLHTYKCNNCNESFSSKFHLKVHMRSHKQTFSECRICLKKFKHAPNLKRHDNIVHKGLKPYKCDICSKEFATLTRKTEHMHIHTGERPHICAYCGTGFKKHSTRYAHEIRHKIKNGEIPKREKKPKKYPRKLPTYPSEIQCNTCHKIFSSKQALLAHLQIHLGQKSFLCTICGKSFLRKSHLEVHQRIHTGEKPYKCQVCGKLFRQPSCYRNHMLIHKGQKSFICLICQKSFIQASHLQSHLKIHSGEKPYKCTLCGKTFAQNGNLKAHTRVHTGEKFEQSNICSVECNDLVTPENQKTLQSSK